MDNTVRRVHLRARHGSRRPVLSLHLHCEPWDKDVSESKTVHVHTPVGVCSTSRLEALAALYVGAIYQQINNASSNCHNCAGRHPLRRMRHAGAAQRHFVASRSFGECLGPTTHCTPYKTRPPTQCCGEAREVKLRLVTHRLFEMQIARGPVPLIGLAFALDRQL